MQKDNLKKQKIYFYLDDSGVMHQNSKDNYFVYAGYLFLSEEKTKHAKYIYLKNEKSIKTKYPQHPELKASLIKPKHKLFLSKILKEPNFLKISIISDFKKFSYIDFNDIASINRFKDFLIKLLIKKIMVKLKNEKLIDINSLIDIYIIIDNQTIKSNGYYKLNDLILAELLGEFSTNFNFPILQKNKVNLKLKYQDSKTSILVRASDMVANTLRFNISNNNFNKIAKQNFFICDLITVFEEKVIIKSLLRHKNMV
ncbi:DUF3800 domain-containing protein [Mesomycoplasma neurolyticum]|uniref:Protein of uncharacterized function (DUF3800) n=1 Tax=Mesomycoplasma neurolyticum TaxID=2120 RepID=A0A449A5R6_9BACT|nr:DUF3800 domain-containing protein [Mesomycoplasma neurolyticum]VEU59578.1 Protein of uncharacterised function (DUF3800) [Mesomycoplasma neurolyticum]